jgi:hypothetical protein
MFRLSRRTVRHAVTAAFLAIAACGPSDGKDSVLRNPPPRAEFLVVGSDSTYWISTMEGRPEVRGEPLVLARYGGRWYEVYSADDDKSYDDALARRPIPVSPRSPHRRQVLVFADTVVAANGRGVCALIRTRNPCRPTKTAKPIRASKRPPSSIFLTFGPFLSYEYRLDVSTRGGNCGARRGEGSSSLRQAERRARACSAPRTATA